MTTDSIVAHISGRKKYFVRWSNDAASVPLGIIYKKNILKGNKNIYKE